ncbi:hypothetical protein EST38_g10632 [Candolleomyces aberdarensis]|uniref:Uncharacterized protein n=1 Tax=Candolleomyces aberdarensis TaxID=2316362 RepID=A0A4Q2D941_9AGAR|nr:hypothetical protein EST38_g10632 [Candolleomyces aberdarensis]
MFLKPTVPHPDLKKDASRRSSKKHYWRDPEKARQAARKRSKEYRDKKKRHKESKQDEDVIPTSSSMERELPEPDHWMEYWLEPTDPNWQHWPHPDPNIADIGRGDQAENDFEQLFINLDKDWEEMEECKAVEQLILNGHDVEMF